MSNENPNAKWITIHPNDAEEGKGKHILIDKTTGEIEGGNPHLVQALKEKGAKVSPSAPTAPTGSSAKSEYDPDMGDLMDDGSFGFSAPKDDEFAALFEDESKREKKEFPKDLVESFLSNVEEDEKPIVKKMMEEHPDWFTVDPIGGNLAYTSMENYHKSVEYIKGEKAKANVKPSTPAESEVNEMATAFTPPSDDEFAGLLDDEENGEDPSAILAKNLMGEGEKESSFPAEAVEKYVSHIADIYSFDAEKQAKLKEIIAQHPELFKVLPSGKNISASDGDSWNKIVNLLKDEPAASAPKFTEEQIKTYADGEWGDHYGEDYSEYAKKVVLAHPELFEVKYGLLQPKSFSAATEIEQQIEEAKSGLPPYGKNGLHVNETTAPTEQESGVEGTTASTQQSAPLTNPLPPPPPAKPVSAELTEGGYPFPKDAEGLAGLTKVKALGGASGANATLYKDADGNMFVMKRFDPSDKAGQQRIKEECDADAYYLAGGANVPHFKLYGDEASGYTKLSQYIPGTQTLGSVWKSADKAMQEKIRANLSQNFALDVMAGAWDVLGTGMDNVLVDQDGNVWRCDNGGAFNRRAQGGEKDEANWGSGHIDDLWTMRGKAAGLDGKTVSDGTGKAEMFGGITTHQLLSDIASRDWDKMISHLPDATRQVMEKRIANAKEYHAVCDNVVTAGKYGDGQHSEDITLNYHCLNKFGLKAGCTNENVGPHNWGWLRGDGNGNPAPTLSKFLTEEAPKLSDFTDAPEPKLESYLPSGDVNQAANILKTAGISLNKHLFVDKDGKPNMASVDAALALKQKLAAVAAAGNDANAKKAKEMLAYVQQIENMKEDGFQNLEKEMPHSPSGAVDLNTPESKAAAEEEFKTAHAEWENKVSNAKTEFAKTEAAYAKKKKAAEKKLATAMKKWEAENGGKAFKFKNVTAAYEEFCKQNGITSHNFWHAAEEQASSSQSEGSCRMKVLETLAMGGNLDHPYTSVPGISDHTSKVKYIAETYKSDPAELKKDKAAYLAMKALTQMILFNSTFTGNFKDKQVVRMCRTENYDDVVDAYDLKHGIVNYKMGAHESFGVFNTCSIHGTEAMVCDVPYTRISSLYFLRRPNGGNMYLGDGENEAGVNAVGIPKLYWKKVKSGIPITKAYAQYEKAFKIKSPKVA